MILRYNPWNCSVPFLQFHTVREFFYVIYGIKNFTIFYYYFTHQNIPVDTGIERHGL